MFPKHISPYFSDYSAVGKCHDRLIPMCADLGYNRTIVSNETQALMVKWFYNTTLDSPSLNFSDYSLPKFLEDYIKPYSKCASVLIKMFCVEFLPPCYEGDLKRFYGLCKSECRVIADECPDFFRYHPEEVELCEEYADEISINGFCAHTSWPKSMPFYYRKYGLRVSGRLTQRRDLKVIT